MNITIQNLSKSYGGRDIFHDFSLDIVDGMRLCVCGPNGTGKSTLLRMLAGVDAPDGGRVIIPHGCRVGYVEQILDEKTLDKRLLSDFDKHKNSDFINALGELLPKKLIPVMIEKSGIDPREKVNSITKAQRAALLRVLKAFPVEISGKRPIAEAIITTGGVSVREVSPKTMESKKLPHLYFAGEVLDVDAYTGGFNLQIAWSTGRLAGLSAAEEES